MDKVPRTQSNAQTSSVRVARPYAALSADDPPRYSKGDERVPSILFLGQCHPLQWAGHHCLAVTLTAPAPVPSWLPSNRAPQTAASRAPFDRAPARALPHPINSPATTPDFVFSSFLL